PTLTVDSDLVQHRLRLEEVAHRQEERGHVLRQKNRPGRLIKPPWSHPVRLQKFGQTLEHLALAGSCDQSSSLSQYSPDECDVACNHICAIKLSITCARVWREQVCLVRLPLPVLGIWRWLTLYGDVWPDLSISSIDLEPLFESRLSVRFDRIDRAFRLANTAIDAFVRVDDKHVLTLIEAVHRTYLDTVHVLTFDTAFIDDVGQSGLLPAVRPEAISVWNSCVIIHG